MVTRARAWLHQAFRDLEQARDSRPAGRHVWACFAAQQAAKKAGEALHLHYGQEPWGHVVARLLQEPPENLQVPADSIEGAKVLDNFYIPTRYPNSHPAGAPFEHYGPLQSELALAYAREILDFVRLQMAG